MIGAWDYPFADNTDHPGSPITHGGQILLTGWALGWGGPVSVIVSVDGRVHAEVTPDFRREDIDIIFHSQKEAGAPTG